MMDNFNYFTNSDNFFSVVDNMLIDFQNFLQQANALESEKLSVRENIPYENTSPDVFLEEGGVFHPSQNTHQNEPLQRVNFMENVDRDEESSVRNAQDFSSNRNVFFQEIKATEGVAENVSDARSLEQGSVMVPSDKGQNIYSYSSEEKNGEDIYTPQNNKFSLRRTASAGGSENKLSHEKEDARQTINNYFTTQIDVSHQGDRDLAMRIEEVFEDASQELMRFSQNASIL